MHQLTTYLLPTTFCLSTQGMTRGTWSPVTVGSHSQDGRWSSAISAAYGCTCRVQRSRNPTFPTSFTATSAGTCGGRDTKRTPRHEEDGWDPQEHPPCFFSFCCPLDSCFLWCLQPKQPKLSPGWQMYCHFVGFLFDNHNHSYLSLTYFVLFVSYGFYFLWLLWRGGQKATWQWRIIYLLLINSFINWL